MELSAAQSNWGNRVCLAKALLAQHRSSIYWNFSEEKTPKEFTISACQIDEHTIVVMIITPKQCFYIVFIKQFNAIFFCL